MAKLEHVNITVSNPEATANMLCELFDWHIRWQGPSALGGHTFHVGTEADYVALYTPDRDVGGDGRTGSQKGGLNHVGVVVDDLTAVEDRVKAAGFKPFNHSDYEPGKRFYFLDGDNIEFEIVSYASA